MLMGRFFGYPHMFYSRGGVCDLNFVLQRMACIPEDLKLEVSKKYESFGPVHGGEKRKAANFWLNNEALKYRNAPAKKDDVLERVNSECKGSESTQEPRLNISDISIPKDKPKAKASFLDGLLNEVDKKHRRNK